MTVNTLHIQLMLSALKGFHNFVSMASLHPSLSHLDCVVNVFSPFLEKAWKLHLVASLLESVSHSLFPVLFPLLLEGLLELVFPLFFAAYMLARPFFVSSFQLQRGHGLFFVFFL